MSDSMIYDDVIRMESDEMNRERVEMMVDIYESADFLRNHDFRTETNTHQTLLHTGSDCVKMRSSRASTVCLGLLCVLLLTAVTVLSVYSYTNITNYTQETNSLTKERDQLLINITDLKKQRDELLNKNINLAKERNGLLTKNDNLTKQREWLIKEINELVKGLDNMDGWLYYKFSLYFYSSKKKNWSESRRYCTDRGADLIIINNREEQTFVNSNFDTGVWIGLTDSNVEGRWKWVDGSTLNYGFWWYSEPDSHAKENCAASFLSGWYDYQCNYAYKWICEKRFVKYRIP